MMDRRNFIARLAAGAGAVGAGAVLDGCGGVGVRPTLGDAETRELIARLERGASMLRDQPFGVIAREQGRSARPDLNEHVFRMTMEALMALDVLRSIPEGVEPSPALRAQLAPLMSSLDRSVHTHRALLERMPRADRIRLDNAVRTDPALVMNVAERIDDHAAQLGIPLDNRARLRHSAASLGARIRRQSTNAVIDDCIVKVDQMLGRSGTTLPADLTRTTGAIVDAMWQQVADDGTPSWGTPAADGAVAHAAARGPDPLAVPSRFGTEREMDHPTEPVQWTEFWASPGDSEIRVGWILMVLTPVSCAVTLIIGLIVLITGVSQNGSWDGQSHPPGVGGAEVD